jgi:hypothetical protein
MPARIRLSQSDSDGAVCLAAPGSVIVLRRPGSLPPRVTARPRPVATLSLSGPALCSDEPSGLGRAWAGLARHGGPAWPIRLKPSRPETSRPEHHEHRPGHGVDAAPDDGGGCRAGAPRRGGRRQERETHDVARPLEGVILAQPVATTRARGRAYMRAWDTGCGCVLMGAYTGASKRGWADACGCW